MTKANIQYTPMKKKKKIGKKSYYTSSPSAKIENGSNQDIRQRKFVCLVSLCGTRNYKVHDVRWTWFAEQGLL